MDRKMLDRAVPLVYVILIVASAMFFPVALAAISIFGALVLAGWYSFVRPALRSRERGGAERFGDFSPPDGAPRDDT